MSAAYLSNGSTTPTQLDARAALDAVITAKDIEDPERLARLLQDLTRKVARIERAWKPDVVYFRDRVVDSTGTTKHLFHHGFGGRVNWHVVGVHDSASYDDLREHEDTDENTLVLVSFSDTTITLRVEAAG